MHRANPLAGRYGGVSSNKRPSIGQAYACQSSPTQPHAPEKKHFHKPSDHENEEDANAKQGMRSWRIHSYLSTYEDGGDEGLAQPMGPDAFEDPSTSQPPNATEDSGPQSKLKEPPTVPPKPRPNPLRPRFGKPILSESKTKDSAPSKTTDLHSSTGNIKVSEQEKKGRGLDKGTEKETDSETREVGVDVEMKEGPDLFLSKHESFRSRINPLLQRSSRLRSSLIFSTSKAEMHNSGLGLKPATEEDDQLDSVRTSSIVTQMLEKRRSFSREPFEWRKKFEENKEKDKEEKEEKEQRQEKKKIEVKDELKVKQEPEKMVKDLKITPTVEKSEDETKPKSTNKNDAASHLEYFKDLAAKRKAQKMETQESLKAPEPAEKKPDLSDKPQPNPVTTRNIPPASGNPAEHEPKKTDIAAKLAELTRRPSVSSSKPPLSSTKPSVSYLKSLETSQSHKEESASEGQKKDIFKSLKPLPSPKLFRREPVKLKGLNPRRSCGEEILTTDATDAEKSEMKKTRSHSSSVVPRDDSKEGLPKFMGSNTSLNTLGESKPLDFLKKHTQKIRGILGPKDKEKKSSGDDRGTNTVIDKDAGSTTNDQTTTNNKTSTGHSGSSRYQSPNSSVLFSSNLRDDTKVILEQISANSQKNRQEREEPAGDKDSDSGEKALEKQNSLKRNKFLRPQGNTLEREGLLKRIESLRKEKKVYSRFEVVYRRRNYVCITEGKEI